jgi:hypothetical protein
VLRACTRIADANLCTASACPNYRDNFAFFNMFASSWYRMANSQVPAHVE